MKHLIKKISAIANAGESNKNIFMYWLPEMISATILISLPPMIDSWIITRLGSTTLYGALGMGSNFLHILIKCAESIPVAAIAIIGRHNGAEEYEKCGEGLGDTFWTTFILGLIQFVLLYTFASSIYRWLDVPEGMIAIGTPFLQLKSLGVFFIFITLGLFGFMRAVKNTTVPMILNLLGIASFTLFDYVLVLGKCGFPKYGLMGSAFASIIQNILIIALALAYILYNPEYKKYFSKVFFSIFDVKRALTLLNLSWPIIIDKITIASSYVWLSKMIASMGKNSIATFDVVKNCERFALLPAIASASVITFLVSNNLGSKNYIDARANIKKIFILSCLTVIPTTLILCANAPFFIGIFDPLNKITAFASIILPIISLLSFFDFPQLVLSGALRGAGDVKMVMLGRFFACAGFFVPVSYMLNKLPGISDATRFILVYGSFYITTGLMGLAFLYRIKSKKWQKHNI